ncbi:MAG: hypothetical protein DMF61_02100 [Blastocatellia bacterium AA13]|nr:MAG: hypothetical protein DMF61_02100 [Blastocatellia bacterium AA13]
MTRECSELQKTALPSDPGFTWELLCLTILALGFVGSLLGLMIMVANGKAVGLPLLLIAFSLDLALLKLAPILSNKYRSRQRLASLQVEELIRNDKRPPVLYLRSFREDNMNARAIVLQSIEQEMKSVLFDIGPFVAFAEPDSHPSAAGAFRLKADRETWHGAVCEAMSKARLVIMRVSDSPGFLWEAREAIRRVRPEQLVFLITGDKKGAEYVRFRQNMAESLPCQLPEYKKFKKKGGIVYFEPDWTPRLRMFKIMWFRQTFWNLFAATFKLALKPVYEQLEVKWTRPPMRLIQAIYLLALVILVCAVVYYLYKLCNHPQCFLRNSSLL